MKAIKLLKKCMMVAVASIVMVCGFSVPAWAFYDCVIYNVSDLPAYCPVFMYGCDSDAVMRVEAKDLTRVTCEDSLPKVLQCEDADILASCR